MHPYVEYTIELFRIKTSFVTNYNSRAKKLQNTAFHNDEKFDHSNFHLHHCDYVVELNF